MRQLIKACILSLALVPGMAAAAQPPCLTPAEFTALAGYALPSVITGATKRCTQTLPRDAFLPRSGEQLAARYGEGKQALWPGAKAAFLKISKTGSGGGDDVIRTLPDATLQLMFDGVIEGMIGQKLPTERCEAIDRVVRLLSPLPPQNTAELIALAAGLGSKVGEAKVGSFAICQTS